MSQARYDLVVRTPTVEEHLRLRTIAGLTPFAPEAIAQGLEGTVHAVVILHEGIAIGMGRIIGDGGCFFQVVDIAVDPNFQGRGLGKRIMAALTEFIEAELPATAYVSLIADGPANKLYEQYGFIETMPASRGMFRWASSERDGA
ncbi:MAG: GNAT family N-acetyltransferase [Pseudomonadota bacterium]